MRHPRTAFLCTASAILFATGCSSTTEPDPAIVLQSFDLATVDAATLPEMVLQEYDYDLWVNSEKIEIRDDDRVRFVHATVRVLVTTPPQPRTVIGSMPERTSSFTRPFVIEGDSIKVYASSSCMTAGCTMEARGTLIGGSLVLNRMSWSPFRVFDYTETPVVP